jgi:phosphatidylethanolamine/phosphatidyl-N-methylethanolamine N-methyltransferase
MSINDTLLFLRSLLRNPWRVAALAPSGRALAELITADFTPAAGPIIELGPGTGSFTRVLLERGVPEDRLALVESDPAFAEALKRRFPRARVLRMDAAQLGQVESFFGRERAGAVVSGLPLVWMPGPTVEAILAGAFHRHLRSDGAFYQFTYWRRCPVPRSQLEQMRLEAARTGSVMANLPPASVYRIRRCAPEPCAPALRLAPIRAHAMAAR